MTNLHTRLILTRLVSTVVIFFGDNLSKIEEASDDGIFGQDDWSPAGQTESDLFTSEKPSKEIL